MYLLIRRTHLIQVITGCLVVFCGTPASVAAQAFGVDGLGMLGKTYSFSMNLDPADNAMGHGFTANNAVQLATLTRTSGGGFVLGAPGGTRGLVVGIDTGERGVGYVYRVHGAAEHATMLRTSGRTNTDPGTQGGIYSFTRDTDNHLWWAVPH